MTDFKIRSAKADDIRFIYSTWLRSFKHDSSFGRSVTSTRFFSYYPNVLDRILGLPDTKVIVACLPDDEQVILGYLVFQPDILHYVFIKESFRQFGIAKDLYISAFSSLTKSILFTHKTKSIELIVDRHPQLSFDPFQLYK